MKNPALSVTPKASLAIPALSPIVGRMSALFTELDYRETSIGALSLRRRRELKLDADVYEIKLGEQFLMSSLFTASEIALADLGISALTDRGTDLAVVVGGLGLGYTARAVLAHENVTDLVVVDALDAVIDWHRSGLLPLGAELTGDTRCRFRHGDFFALAEPGAGFDPDQPGRRFDAILVDIDHSPEELLDGANARFYTPQGLQAVADHLLPGGVFGLWSNLPPEETFVERLAEAFAEAWAEPVSFHNPLQDREVVQTVYLARTSHMDQT